MRTRERTVRATPARPWEPAFLGSDVFLHYKPEGINLVGGAVDSWSDAGPNGIPLTCQLGATRRPGVQSAYAGGYLPAVKISGAASPPGVLQTIDFGAAPPPYTVYFVGDSDGLGTLDIALCTVGSYSMYLSSRLGGYPETGDSGIRAAAAIASTPYLHCSTLTATGGGVGTLYINDTAAPVAAQGPFPNPRVVGVLTPSTLMIGASGVDRVSFPWRGSIAEILVCQSVHDAATRALVAAYIRRRYPSVAAS